MHPPQSTNQGETGAFLVSRMYIQHMHARFRSLETGPLSNKRILVIGHSFLGDALMTTPCITAIQQKGPAHLGILASGPGLDVYSRLKGSITLHDRTSKGILAQLRNEAYTMVFVLKDDFASSLLAFRCRIRTRIGIAREFSSLLFTQAYIPSNGKKPPENLALRFALSEQELSRAKELLAAVSAPYIVLAPTTTRPEKDWPVEHCRSLIQLLSRNEHPVVIVGSARDTLRHRLITAETCATDLTGLTTTGEAAAIIGNASGVVACDSGPMHIAAALEVPLVALFGQTDPARSGPCSPHAVILRAKTACAPCLDRHCGPTAPCMASISPEQVYSTIFRILP